MIFKTLNVKTKGLEIKGKLLWIFYFTTKIPSKQSRRAGIFQNPIHHFYSLILKSCEAGKELTKKLKFGEEHGRPFL